MTNPPFEKQEATVLGRVDSPSARPCFSEGGPVTVLGSPPEVLA